MTRTDYLCIHEAYYDYLKKIGKKSFSEDHDTELIMNLVLDTIKEYDLPKSIKILELGCGDAELSLALAELGYNVSGIDISPTAIDWAHEKASDRNLKTYFITGDVINMEFEDNSFDLVIDSYCLHCIIGEDREKFLKEIKRILKPDGFLTGITMSNTIPDEIKEMFNDKREMVRNGIAGRYIGLSDNILKEFTDSGFEILDYSVTEIDKEADDLKYVLKPINN